MSQTLANTAQKSAPKQRLKRAQRHQQLLQCAWQLIADEGTDALTLGRLAEVAGVAKPVTYDHFTHRQGLLAALWQDFIDRQQQRMAVALTQSHNTLPERVQAIAHSYLDCVLQEAQQMPQILAALSGSAHLSELRKTCRVDFLRQCQDLLAPFLGKRGLPDPTGVALLGAADALAQSASEGDISANQAQTELCSWFLWAIQQSHAESVLKPGGSGKRNHPFNLARAAFP